MQEKTDSSIHQKKDIAAASFEPKILGFVCNWCTYAAADLAGISRYQYPTNIRLIRVMCSCRVDLVFLFRAFAEGMDGILVGGCHLSDCHYIDGNYTALRTISVFKKLLGQIGIDPRRLRLEWLSASEGIIFSQVVSDFTQQLKTLGPLNVDGTSKSEILKLKLQAAEDMVPYIKLVEGQKLEPNLCTEVEYEKLFNSGEMPMLFQSMITYKLVLREILLLLRERNHSIREISRILDSPSPEISKILKDAVNRGLVSLDKSAGQFIANRVETAIP